MFTSSSTTRRREVEMTSERKVPIARQDYSFFDDECSSVRDRFESEMSKMEDEMSKFRSQLINKEREYIGAPRSSTTQQTTTRTSSSTHHSGNPTAQPAQRTELRTWLDNLDSPLIQDSDAGDKEIKLRFDVSQYTPEEIVVKTVDNKLEVHAKHEEKSESRSVYREYNREFLLPRGTNPEDIKSALSKDGILTIQAPLPSIEGPKERLIPIDKK